MAATVVFFGQHPTTIILQSSNNFNGTAHTGTYEGGTIAIDRGIATFAPQAGGGLYDFHTRVGTQEPIDIKNISYKGGGTCTVKKKLDSVSGTPTVLVYTFTAQGEYFENITLSPSETLIFESAGATNPVVSVTASLTSGMWAT